MPTFRVEALEKFVVRTIYHVDARTPAQAEQMCRSGCVAYEEHRIEEGDEEWIETVAIEPAGDLIPARSLPGTNDHSERRENG